MRNITEIQLELIRRGYPVGPAGADGKFGGDTLDAYNHFRASLGKPPVGSASMAMLNADLFPEEQPKPKPIRKPGLFDVLAAINTISNIIKGKTMTSDQITGAVRAVLGILLTWLVAKGIIPAGSADLIVTAVLGVILAGWSVYNNRPSNSAPK